MCIVALPDRLASASVVFFGQHGAITQHALRRGVCRQRLYREARSVLRDLDLVPLQQQIAHLQQQLAQLRTRLQERQTQQSLAVVCNADLQAEFVATAQAEGVSLPVTHRLLRVLLRRKTPSVATLGRLSQRAGQRAGALLQIFDEQARPRVRQAAADEIFFGKKPVLMVVEPQSHCWLSGRLSPSRDAQQWAQELEQLPALEQLTRDGGTGLAKGLAEVNEQRRQRQQPAIGDQLDHFHTLREGYRALRKTQAQAERAWTVAEEADKKVLRQDRQGFARRGYASQAVLKWHKAEAAFQAWERGEQILQQIRQALRPFSTEGDLNRREQVVEQVKDLASQLHGEQWDKFKRQLAKAETYTYLDRLHDAIVALPVAAEVREALVQSEGIRQNPKLVQGEGQGPAVLRGMLLVCSVLIAQAGEVGQQALAALRRALRYTGKASSCVEGLNSVVRMQQNRHRKMTQGLLDLKRLYWNLRRFRTGVRKGTRPYERLGVPLPPDLSWWQILQLEPDELRLLLSALPQTT